MDTISPSQITSYLACPRKFSFRYIERLPLPFKAAALAFGSAVHSALEVFHGKLADGEHPTPEVIAGIFRTDWHAELAGDLCFKEDESPESLGEQGETLVRLYVTQNQDLSVRAVEWPFEVPLGDMETGEIFDVNLRGIFDLVLADDVLVELKTAARAYDQGTLARHVQLSAYAYAYRSCVGPDPKIRVVALLKNKKPRIDRYEAVRTAKDDGWFVHLAAEVHRGIVAGVFPPSPGWQCSDCEYAEPCREWRGACVSPLQPADERRHLPVVEARVP